MSQPPYNPFVWVNPDRTPQPASQSEEPLAPQIGPGPSRSHSMGLSVTFGVSGRLIQSRKPRLTFPDEPQDPVDFVKLESKKDAKSSLVGLRSLVFDDGQASQCGIDEAFASDIKIKLEEEERAITASVERVDSTDLCLKVEKVEAPEEAVCSYSLSPIYPIPSLCGRRDEKQPEQISQDVNSSDSRAPALRVVNSDSATSSTQYPSAATLRGPTPQIPFSPPRNMMRPMWPRRPSLSTPHTFSKPRHYTVWRPRYAPWAFPPPVNWHNTWRPPVARPASNIERPRLINTSMKPKEKEEIKPKKKDVQKPQEKEVQEPKEKEVKQPKEKEVEVSPQLHTVWLRTKPTLFRKKLGTLCLKYKKIRNLKNFVRRGVCNLLIEQVSSKPDVELMSHMQSELRPFLPPECPIDFFIMTEVGAAVVALPPGEYARDIVQHSNCEPDKRKRFRMRVLKENLGSSPRMFYEAVMEIIDPSAEADGSKTVYFETIAEEEVAELHKTFKDSLQYFMPLHGKLFVEFSTPEEADQFGFQFSQKNQPFGKEIYRLGFTPHGNMSATNGSWKTLSLNDAEKSFWVTIPVCPYLFPTVTPSFVIPEHKTIKDMADVEADRCNFRTVMMTNLPLGWNAHCAIRRRVQAHIPNMTPQFDNYCIIILPLQRRAFVHFDDWESCSSCLGDFFRIPKLCLHLVTQSMCPQYKEDAMYESLMALSNTPIQNSESLSERLLVVSVDADLRKRNLRKLLDTVTSVGPFVGFLPLGNRICIEMVNSEDVTRIVENYRTLSSSQKYEMFPIANFESCEALTRRLNLASEKQVGVLQSEGSGEAEPSSSDVVTFLKSAEGSSESSVSAEIQESRLEIDASPEGVLLEEDMEYEIVDCLADQTSGETKRESQWHSTTTEEQPKVSAADTAVASQRAAHKELYELMDCVDKDVIHVCCTETSGSSLIHEKRRSNVSLEKRKSEMAGPEAKRSRTPFTSDAAGFELPAFTPNNPLGQEFVRLKSGFSCNLCSVFYLSKSTAEKHCCSQLHHTNLKNYHLRLQP